MSRPLAVLRPEPGNAETIARIAALGLTPLAIPLFDIRPVRWTAPDPSEHDALILTSANAIRMGAHGLDRLRALPVFAVGDATADAARAAGFIVIDVGTAGAGALAGAAQARGVRRALHLGGRDRTLAVGGPINRAITVYASEPRALERVDLAAVEHAVALLHSARAAIRLRECFEALGLDRRSIRIAALSQAVAAAAGAGWREAMVARTPTDDALIDAARRLAD